MKFVSFKHFSINFNELQLKKKLKLGFNVNMTQVYKSLLYSFEYEHCSYWTKCYINLSWHGDDQPMALMSCKGSNGNFKRF